MGPKIAIRGWGAVSPAGWGADFLSGSTLSGIQIPTKPLGREGKSHPASGRRVAPPQEPLPFTREPRLRRASAVGRFGVAAALEALGDRRREVESGELRTGIIFCAMNGIVEYSRRFYGQVLENPAFASPILFPETVYNAPSSHLSALLGSSEINYTLLGDSSQFISGLDLAAHWLANGRTDACLVVAAEEIDWLSAEAFQLFEPGIPVSEGAAALFLERTQVLGPGDIQLRQIAGPTLYSPLYTSRVELGCELRRSLEVEGGMLIDGKLGGARSDSLEEAVWDGWEGEKISPLRTTGAAFSVDAGWQCVLAAHLLSMRGNPTFATVSALGGSQQAAAAVFQRMNP